ncbi:MAG: hypothetical protein JXR37_12495 [Kiritimatiellae bacterium]|nr:hypothetical protein [Kiritimatiellia bacterium]
MTHEERTTSQSPRWSYPVFAALVALGFLSFGLSLDRYPPFYVDEPFFHAAAVRQIDGRNPGYVHHSQAPYHDAVWAYHGPFLKDFQVLIFRWLGVSHFACRIPRYAAAHAGILLLGLMLLRRGLYRTALALGVAWLGDASLLEITQGRPEGLSLFFVIVAFAAVLTALDSAADTGGRSRRLLVSAALASFGVGMAAGFQPSAAHFGWVVCLVLLLRLPRSRLIPAALAMGAGVLPVIGLVLYCWRADVQAAFRQFVWSVSFGAVLAAPGRSVELQDLIAGTDWPRFWYLALIATSLVVLPLLCGGTIRRWRSLAPARNREAVAPVAWCFALGGLVLFVASPMCDYYFVFFTVWPVVGLAACLETRGFASRRMRAAGVWAGLLLLAWLPSLAWNALRFREVVLFYRVFDKRPLAEEFRRHVPPGAVVMGDPIYFIVARDAGLEFTPLPFFHHDRGIQVAPDAWLLLTPRYVDILNSVDSRPLTGRKLVYHGTAFAGSVYTRHPFLIYGPAADSAPPEYDI